jgi:hypothetical protein
MRSLSFRRGVWAGRVVGLQGASQEPSKRLRVLVANGPIKLGMFDLEAFDALQVDPGEGLPRPGANLIALHKKPRYAKRFSVTKYETISQFCQGVP